jgi:formyltetrahydrofolate deformylase
MKGHYRLIISCPDKMGIVAAVSNFIVKYNGLVSDASYYADEKSKWFFMRNEISSSTFSLSIDEFKKEFQSIADEYDMSWQITYSEDIKRVVLMVSQYSHCLADLLHRRHAGDLDCEIVAVISNHQSLEAMTRWYEIPFHYVNMADDKKFGNQEIAKHLAGYSPDVVVLARYMQLIPAELCESYNIINIHHSFLPSFIGANPYQHAYDRGVKLVGATCHYVTEKLDQGPIIEQDVKRVTHKDSKEDMLKKGKEVEKNVLAQGLQLHLEDRVMVHNNKTIILN